MDDMNTSALLIGRETRARAVLDYGQRRNFDWYLQFVFPYEFWYTHTFGNLIYLTADRPALATAYYRLALAVKKLTDSPEYPERMKGKIRIPLPILPKWMGGEIYFDPLRTLTPIPTFTEPYIPREEEGESPLAKAYRYGASIMSPAPWVTGPLAAAGILPRERLKEMAQIPPLRYARGLTGLAGIGPPGGVGIQEPWDIYRAERMLSNMVNTGEITPQQAQDAMMSHRGPIWEQAVRRAAQERGITLTGQMAGVSGVSVFPTGERLSYKLREELRKELDKAAPGFTGIPYAQTAAWREQNPKADKAISKVYTEFYKRHPEYQVRSFLFKDPRERAISQVWTAYNALSRAGKRQARADLGNKFATYFVNKSKRDYTKFATQELADIAERLGAEAGIARVAGTEAELRGRPLIEPAPSPYGEPPPPAGQVVPDIARDYNTFLNHRARHFPGILPIQNQYFAFPQGSQQRRTFLAQHPRLKEYWEWARKFKAEHPRFATWYARMTGQAVAPAAAYAPYVPRPQVRVPWGGGGGRRVAPQAPQAIGPRQVQPRIGMPPPLRWYRQYR